MKNIYALFVALLVNVVITTILNSAPIKDLPVELVQPDGSVIKCFLSGDEFFNFYHTQDGYFIKQGHDGSYYYADKSESNIIITDYKINEHNPQTLGINKWLKPNPEDIKEVMNYYSPQRNHFQKEFEQTLALRKGTINNLVVFIKFAKDSEFTDDISYYDNLYNNDSNTSIRNFYKEASYNNLDVVSHFFSQNDEKIISYTDQFEREYYLPYNETVNPMGYIDYFESRKRGHKMLFNALTQIKNSISPNLNLDNNNDGYIDNITFIIKGSSAGWGKFLWPHFSTIDHNIIINEKKAHFFNLMLSDLIINNRNYGIGTLAHEFFHTLGAPDLYHYSHDAARSVGIWDLMASTLNPPQFMSNFSKWLYTGWIEHIPEITSEGKYFLNPNTSPIGSIYRIKPRKSSNEFFILEYRKTEGLYDKKLPGCGLLVYRINPEYLNRGNRDGPPDGVYIFRPDVYQYQDGRIEYANFNRESHRTSIGEYTNPPLLLTNNVTAGLEIFNISDCGETISFEVSYTMRTNIVSPLKGSFDQSLLPEIKWRKVPQADSYFIELSEDKNFLNNIIVQKSINDTILRIDNQLRNSTIYYARVKWQSLNFKPDWSDVVQFVTIPNNPILVEPENNSWDISIATEFKWNKILNTKYYRIQISDSPEFNNIIYSKSMITDTILKLTVPLQLNTKYYWHIRSVSYTGYIADSEVYSFITKERDLAVAGTSKSRDVCTGESFPVKVFVKGSPTSYQWYFNDKIIQDEKDSILFINNFNLTNAGKYHCIVTDDESGIIEKSSVLELVEIKLSNLNEVPLFKITRTESYTYLHFIPEHNLIDFLNVYALQWYRNGTQLTDGYNYSGTKSQQLTILQPDLSTLDSTYFLRLISICGDTVYSGKNISSVSVDDIVSNSNYLNIYPNPANNRIYIEFSDEQINTEFLKVEMFDYTGRAVAEFRPESISKNSLSVCRISCDIGSIPNGFYIVVLNFGSYKKSCPIIIE